MSDWISNLNMEAYTCRANLISSENDEALTGVIGNHLGGNVISDVIGLIVFQQRLGNSIPSGVGLCFPRLMGLSWSSSNLETISADDLKQFPNLINLSLYHNILVTLDGNLLQHTPKLQVVSFYDNSLEHVGHDLLRGLNNLTWVDFRWNPCIEASADTRQAIQELNLQLPISCPPLATTTDSNTCSPDCMERIEMLDLKITEMVESNIKLREEDSQQNKEISALRDENVELGRRLAKLENLLSGISVP